MPLPCFVRGSGASPSCVRPEKYFDPTINLSVMTFLEEHHGYYGKGAA